MLAQPTQHSQTKPPAAAARINVRKIEVLLVDDHPALRLGMGKLIDDQPDMRVVGDARSADDALHKLQYPVDVAIVDYHLGDGQDGLWLTTALKRREPAPRVLVYSAFADGALAVAALIAGADGLLGKHELGDELCSAIRRLARGRHHLPAISRPLADAMRSQLEARDQAIFGMLLHGMAPQSIAERLGITEGELHARRSIMLRSFKSRPSSGLHTPTRAPLDYQRPKRRASGRAA